MRGKAAKAERAVIRESVDEARKDTAPAIAAVLEYARGVEDRVSRLESGANLLHARLPYKNTFFGRLYWLLCGE